MTDKRPKLECPICKKTIRLLGKHVNQKHPSIRTRRETVAD